MTAPIQPAQFDIKCTFDRAEVAAMWRGALIDKFAHLEKTALQCLQRIGAASHANAGSYVTWKRFAELRAKLPPDARSTIALLAKIECEHELRIALAHGRMTVSQSGITLNWDVWDGARWEAKHRHLPWLTALATLCSVDKLRRDFSSQCGQLGNSPTIGNLP